MLKALLTSFLYAFAFGSIVHFVSPLAGFDHQETNLLYLFSAVLIFSGIIAPAMEESIEAHNKRANELIEAEQKELQAIEEELNETSKFIDELVDLNKKTTEILSKQERNNPK